MSKRRLVDTNLIVRFLVQDHEKHAKAAGKLFEACDRGDLVIVLLPAVLAECVFVLESFYQHGRGDIASALGTLISSPGVEIQVPNIREDVPPKAAKVVISKSKHLLEALNAAGRVVAEYPTTSGSEHDPLPLGNWKVTRVTPHPVFFYNPDLFWNAPESDAKAKIQPGPNNPAGVVWIGISKEHYGIHGTPEPSLVGHAESHGCIRLTNWDAAELAKIVTKL